MEPCIEEAASKELLELEKLTNKPITNGNKKYVIVSKLLDQKTERNGKPTFSMKKSTVLGKVKDFIPKFKIAQEELRQLVEEKGEDKINIEVPDEETEGPVISMNLSLFEQDSDLSDEEYSSEEDNFSSNSSISKSPPKKVNISVVDSSYVEK